MIKQNNIVRGLKIAAMCLVLLGAIGFAEKKHNDRVFDQVEVRINNQNGNYFVMEDDVIALIALNADLGDHITAEMMTEMEANLLNQDYIEEAQVYRDLSGKLLVEVRQSEPIARIVRPKDPDAYVSSDGKMLPVSEKYSARVLLVTGNYTDRIINGVDQETETPDRVFELIKYIYETPFWRAQIAQLDIDAQGNVIMYPQVGKQLIEFGDPDNIESKFTRLDTFYRKILPKKGWNEYQRVSVKYTDQIICE